ncbi:hypothetical protein CRG98_015316 [Punica granatum]|uniref:Uncharacterized protein n=1 Tax=Punica granatum TaxID=22663 RepID=A0A2I0K848_PUNGR|nr:hypothetical protein CRG98_015316 [Punica granatum]
MAVFFVYPLNPALHLHSASCTDLSCHFPTRSSLHLSKTKEKGDRWEAGSQRFVAFSLHSNPRILKPRNQDGGSDLVRRAAGTKDRKEEVLATSCSSTRGVCWSRPDGGSQNGGRAAALSFPSSIFLL